MKKYFYIILGLTSIISLTNCTKNSDTSITPTNSNQTTLTVSISLNPGVIVKYNINDGTTSANITLYQQANVSGSQNYNYQVDHDRILDTEIFIISTAKKDNSAIGTVTFKDNNTVLSSYTIRDTGFPFDATIGTTF